jgi:hypothetical protein
MPEERRKHVRRRTFKGGRIVFNRHFSAIDCIVRNLSESGACLEVASSTGIPDDFQLSVDVDGLNRCCHVAWRASGRIGVAFQ